MINELENLGLTNREIDVYLSLLELGSSSVGDIVKKSKVPSSKIYEILNKLISKGLASFIIKNKTRFFQASEPESLLDLAEEKKKSVETLMPKLKSLQNSTKKEEATLFEGKEGLKTALRKVLRLNKGEEYLVYISPFEDMNDESFKIFYNNFNLQRKQAKIKTKLLVNSAQKQIMQKDYLPTLQGQELKFTEFSFPSRIGIFKDHVLLISGKSHITSILIHSEETYQRYRDFFYSLWKNGK